jgi:menaquinone-dependent protoporphyrinogen IX oxidase
MGTGMSSNKTLIAYETKQGASEETARKIAEVLRAKFNLEVDLVDLNEQKAQDLAQYRNVVVGGGVRMGRVYSKVTKFLESNDFSGKRVAFFASSAWGGTPGEFYDGARKRFVENTLAKYPHIPVVAKEAFGGKVVYFKKRMVDNVDLARAEAWAMGLGKLFTE